MEYLAKVTRVFNVIAISSNNLFEFDLLASDLGDAALLLAAHQSR